jgi:hypothetical protein
VLVRVGVSETGAVVDGGSDVVEVVVVSVGVVSVCVGDAGGVGDGDGSLVGEAVGEGVGVGDAVEVVVSEVGEVGASVRVRDGVGIEIVRDGLGIETVREGSGRLAPPSHEAPTTASIAIARTAVCVTDRLT